MHEIDKIKKRQELEALLRLAAYTELWANHWEASDHQDDTAMVSYATLVGSAAHQYRIHSVPFGYSVNVVSIEDFDVREASTSLRYDYAAMNRPSDSFMDELQCFCEYQISSGVETKWTPAIQLLENSWTKEIEEYIIYRPVKGEVKAGVCKEDAPPRDVARELISVLKIWREQVVQPNGSKFAYARVMGSLAHEYRIIKGGDGYRIMVDDLYSDGRDVDIEYVVGQLIEDRERGFDYDKDVLDELILYCEYAVWQREDNERSVHERSVEALHKNSISAYVLYNGPVKTKTEQDVIDAEEDIYDDYAEEEGDW